MENEIEKNVRDSAVHLYKIAKVVEFIEADGQVSVANLDTVNKTIHTFEDIPAPVNEYLFNIAEVMLMNAVALYTVRLLEEGLI